MPKESSLTTNEGNGVTSHPSEGAPETAPAADVGSDAKTELKAEATAKPWSVFLRTAKPPEIQERLAGEIAAILGRHKLDKYCALALFEPEGSIDSYDLDRIFSALSEQNSDRLRMCSCSYLAEAVASSLHTRSVNCASPSPNSAL